MIVRVYRVGFIVSEKSVISGKKYSCGEKLRVHNMVNETSTTSSLKKNTQLQKFKAVLCGLLVL